MRTLVKFELEPRKNAVISKTLGKFAFISREFNDDCVVRPDEYWVVQIVNETLRDHGGNFWVRPLRKLQEAPVPLVAGSFDIKYIDDVALIIPNQASDRWTFPGYQRDVSLKRYVSSVIVDIERRGKFNFKRRRLPSRITNVYRMDGEAR